MQWIEGAGFFLSCWGYLFVFYRIARTEICFVQILTMAGGSLALYAGGLLGLLEPAAYLIYAGGLLCFLWFARELLKRKVKAPAFHLYPFCFAVGAGIFLLFSLQLRLMHYDNFSHWALVVKYMLSSGQFPSAGTELVVFKDYPPGCAVFLFYVCTFLGRSQAVMLAAQNSLILACFYAMTGIVKEKRRFLLYAVLGMGCSMLSYLNLTIRINNLLVDFLLPLLALTSIVITCRCRKRTFLLCVSTSMLLGFTGIVKNTGVVFSGFALLFFLWMVLREKGRFTPGKRGAKRLEKEPFMNNKKDASRGRPAALAGAAVTLTLSFLPFLLWREYVDTVYVGFEEKFSFHTAGGTYQPAEPQQYAQIIRDFIKASVQPSDRAAQVFVLCHVVVILCLIFVRIRMKKRWKLGKVLFLADVVVIGYYAGILYMYLFLMTEEEAVRLAGFDRYACSIMVFFAGSLILCAVTDMEDSFAVPIDERNIGRAFRSPQTKRYYQYGVLTAAAVGINFLYSEINGLNSIQSDYGESLPGRVERLVSDRWYEGGVEDESRYLVAATDRQGQVSDWGVWYVSRYFLYAPNVEVTTMLTQADIPEALEKYDYIVVLEEEAVDMELEGGYAELGREGVYRTEEVERD